MLPEDALLTRKAVAQALIEAGYPTSPATLATKATRGGGPPFRRFGFRPLYKWGDALRWAQSRLGPLISTTSELASPASDTHGSTVTRGSGTQSGQPAVRGGPIRKRKRSVRMEGPPRLGGAMKRSLREDAAPIT
jgi:hypothetical protein